MRKTPLCLTALLACAGCATAAAPPGAVAVAPPPAAAAECRSYTTQVLIDEAVQTLSGTACRQGDGSWRIAETVAGQPGAVVVVYPPAGIVYAPDEAWLWGMPLGLGFGLDAFVFVDHDHRFHVFRHFHDFDRDHVFAHHAPFPSRPPGSHPFLAPGHTHHG